MILPDSDPQGLRNVLLISATPYQWKHMIGQRSCRRNTDEMRIVMLKVWDTLYNLSPVLFCPAMTGPFCQRDKCLEGKMSCGVPISRTMTPARILLTDYPRAFQGVSRHENKNDRLWSYKRAVPIPTA